METGDTRRITVDNTAFEKYLYSVTLEDGKRLDDLENLIADIEGKAAPVLEKSIKQHAIDGRGGGVGDLSSRPHRKRHCPGGR